MRGVSIVGVDCVTVTTVCYEAKFKCQINKSMIYTPKCKLGGVCTHSIVSRFNIILLNYRGVILWSRKSRSVLFFALNIVVSVKHYVQLHTEV